MKVFVYGTLKRGHGNNRLLSQATFLEEKEVEGFKLYNAGFPVAAREEEGRILGEVWDIGDNKETLANLDRLEAEGRMYIRTEIEKDFEMYVGNPPFWGDFADMRECPKDANGRYVWDR